MEQTTDRMITEVKLSRSAIGSASNTVKVSLAELFEQVNQYVFNDVPKAQDVLAQIKLNMRRDEDLEYKLQFHVCTALFENQLYNYQLAINNFEKAIEIHLSLGHGPELAETYIDYAATLINLYDELKVKQVLSEANKLITAFPDLRLKARLLCRQAYVQLYFAANPTRALEYFLEAQDCIEAVPEASMALKDYYFVTLIQSGLGEIYKYTQEYDKSVHAYLAVLKLCEDMGMKSRMAWHFLNVGNAYLLLSDFNSASGYFKAAIKATYDVNQQARAMAYANLGYCFLKSDKFPEALRLFQRAEPLFHDDREKNLAKIEYWRASIFLELGKRKRCSKHLITARNLARKVDDKRQLANILQSLTELHAQEFEYEKAYQCQKEYEGVVERYFLEEKEMELRELEIKYEAEKKEKEAEMLRLQATSLQHKALRAQMNPHFLFNCLNSVQSFITSKEVSLASVYLSKFAILVRKSLDFSELEVISLDKEIAFLDGYLEINEKLRFENRMGYALEVDKEIDEDIIGIPTMIIQPYVENAIEHGIPSKKDGFIRIQLKQEDDDTILCIVEDNGIGRKAATDLQERNGYRKHISYGTKITKERLQLLFKTRKADERAPVSIIDLQKEDGTSAGTRVEILLPILELPMRNHKEY